MILNYEYASNTSPNHNNQISANVATPTSPTSNHINHHQVQQHVQHDHSQISDHHNQSPPKLMFTIKATGEGLRGGTVDSQLTFSVYSIPGKHFNDTLCQVAVDGPAAVDIKLTSVRGTILKCEWIPRRPGHYRITVLYDDRHITGSPFICEITPREKRPAVPDADQTEGITSLLPAFLFSGDRS